MEDFASAAMMRLVRAGLLRQGLGASTERYGEGAHVALDAKRQDVEGILASHGPLTLLRIGDALPDMRDAPVLAAIETAPTPLDAIERWRRLEKYVHSRHRTEIVEAAPSGVTLRHVSLSDGDPPRRSEDLLIFGVLIALARWVGAAALRARPIRDDGWTYDDGWTAAPRSEDCSSWRIEWAASATGLDETRRGGDLSGAVVRLANLIRADPARRWTIDAAAKEVGASRRTLQRLLKARGASFSQTVADIRAAAAVRFLDESRIELGEIGFLCGYADQAHFTRSFKAAMAVTPARYRRAREEARDART